MKYLPVAAGLSLLIAWATAHAEENGSVCLAPFPVASRHLAFEHPLTSATTFTFRFGKHETVTLKQGETKAVASLPVDEKVMVQVLMDGKPYAAFPLRLRDFRTHRACLWLDLPYVTWQAYDYSEKGHGCKCF